MKFFKKSNKFKDYISKTFVLYAIMIVILMLSLFLLSLFFSFRGTVVKSNEKANEGLRRFLEEEYKFYEKSIDSLSKEEAILSVFQEEGSLQRVNNLLYEYSNKENLKANFALLNKKGEILASNLYKNNENRLSNSKHLKNTILKLKDNKNLLYKDLNKVKFDYNQDSSLVFAKAVESKNGIEGYLLFYIKDTSLKPYTRIKGIDITIITDEFHNVIYTTNTGLINNMGKLSLDKWKDEKNTAYFNGEPYHIKMSKVDDESLQIMTMTSTSRYREFLIIGIFFVLAMGILIVILVTILAPRISNRSLRSLDSLTDGVDELKKGNISYKIDAKTFDEFQMILDEFNIMTSKIESLIEDNSEIAERKRIMELKQLENQFNPHFVYNVMEMLRYEIIFNPELASDLLVSFANLMRYNSNYGNVEVLLKTDMDYMENYLSLQKRRFGERLSYEINIDEEILKLKAPKLVLQPIIENSIKHGIENTPRLKINISAIKHKNRLEIIVKDNGQGIEYNRLMYLRKALESREPPEHVGLYNVHRIIRLLYGDPYGLSIESKFRHGSKVTLNIPIIGVDKDA